MATAIDAEKWSDEYIDAKCSICATQNKDEIADHYCYDCNKHMCKSCLGTHNQFNENHYVVQGLEDSKNVLTEKCGKHAVELITLYCRQHEELLCRRCHLLDHRKCQSIQNIRESSDELSADPNLQAVPAQLKLALDNINKAIEALDEHITNIKKNGHSFLKDLEVYTKKLLLRIEELKEKSKKDIKSKQKELLAVTKHHRQACALTKDEINQYLDKITKSKVWKANTFVLKKKGQTIAPKVDALYHESDNLIKGHQFSFMTEMKIFDSLSCFSSLVKEVSTKAQDIGCQGAVGGEVDIPVQAVVKRRGGRQVGRPVKKGGDRPVVRPEKKQINVRIPGDKNMCGNIGCCHLSDGSLVVADYNNRRLKIVDPSSRKVTKYCDTDEQPTDVCCIGPQEVAVAFFSTQVHVYDVVSLTRIRTLMLDHKTFRIACHGSQLYCADWWDNILYVHDVSSGRKLREISKDTNGQNIFSDIVRIALNRPGDRIYVVDSEIGLVCINTDGQMIFRLCLEYDLGLSGVQGLTTDHLGNVFVGGAGSHDVIKVTGDGHVVGKTLSDEGWIKFEPWCLCYDVNMSYLYVGGKDDQLLVVELKSS